MSAHTPGPWHAPHFVEEAAKCQCQSVVSEACYPGAICTIHFDNGKAVGDGGNGAPPLDEAKANARLIAAAPEMLAALNDIASGNVPPGFLAGIEGESKGSFQERLATWMQGHARAAIAKAEGH